MEDEVFVIYGESGEYSDYKMWIVGVTICEVSAKEFIDNLNKKCYDLLGGWKRLSREDYRTMRENLNNEVKDLILDRYGNGLIEIDIEAGYSYEKFSLSEIPKILNNPKK